MTANLKTFTAETPEQWRKWLAQHHDSESEVWLVFHKRHTGRRSIAYLDALDEALCFGWVDSLIKRLDDECYARKFTPRRADSRWSDINRKRYADLKAAGRLAAPGVNRPPTARGYGPRPKPGSPVPKYIRDALSRQPVAFENFKQLPPSHQHMYVLWIDTAKRDETKKKRLDESVKMLLAGKRLGLK